MKVGSRIGIPRTERKKDRAKEKKESDAEQERDRQGKKSSKRGKRDFLSLPFSFSLDQCICVFSFNGQKNVEEEKKIQKA